MQILKDSVRERILFGARRLFAKRGFRDTSMRMIAKEAGVTAGNIYRYFDTKEQILDQILQPVMNHIQSLICEHDDEEYGTSTDGHRSYHEFVARSLVDIHENYQLEYRILTQKAEGTRYAAYATELMTQIGATMYAFSQFSPLGVRKLDRVLYDIIAKNHVDAILYILEHVQESERKESLIRQYLDLHMEMICKPCGGGAHP